MKYGVFRDYCSLVSLMYALVVHQSFTAPLSLSLSPPSTSCVKT